MHRSYYQGKVFISVPTSDIGVVAMDEVRLCFCGSIVPSTTLVFVLGRELPRELCVSATGDGGTAPPSLADGLASISHTDRRGELVEDPRPADVDPATEF